MSRFLRQAGAPATGAYGDSNVCSLLSSYTGTISASNGYNICNLRSGWERIYYQDEVCGDLGSSVEFEVDTSKYIGFCLTMSGFKSNTTSTVLSAGFANSNNCYCTCTSTATLMCFVASAGVVVCRASTNPAIFPIFNDSVSCTAGFNYDMHISPSSCGVFAVRNIQDPVHFCSPPMGLAAVGHIRCMDWSEFSKFKLCLNSGTICTTTDGYGVIQLLGMPKLPNIGVE